MDGFGDDFRANELLRGKIPDAGDPGRHGRSESTPETNGSGNDRRTASTSDGDAQDAVDDTGKHRTENRLGELTVIVGYLLMVTVVLYAVLQMYLALN